MPRQRERLADVLRRASEVRVHGDNDGVVRALSPTVTTHLGWRPDQLIGRPFEELVHEDDVASLRRMHCALQSGRAQRTELRLRRSDGTHVRMAVAMRPVVDEAGTVIGRTGGWRLLDERPWGADTLDDQALRFVAEHTSEVLLLVSSDRFLLWSTSAVQDLLGWQAEALFDRDLETFVYPEDLSAAMPCLEAAFRPQEPVAPAKDLIIRLRSAGDEHVWVSMRLVPLADSDGALLGVVVSLRRVDDLFSSRQQLGAERARLRATLDSLLDPHVDLVAVRDAAGEVVDFVLATANQAACDLYGRDASALIGRRLSDLAPGLWPNGLFERFATAVGTHDPVEVATVTYVHRPGESGHVLTLRAVAAGDQLTCSWREIGTAATGHRSSRAVRVRRRRR